MVLDLVLSPYPITNELVLLRLEDFLINYGIVLFLYYIFACPFFKCLTVQCLQPLHLRVSLLFLSLDFNGTLCYEALQHHVPQLDENWSKCRHVFQHFAHFLYNEQVAELQVKVVENYMSEASSIVRQYPLIL